MTSHANRNEERHQDDSATDTKPPAQDTGGEPYQKQLPRVDVYWLLVHGEHLRRATVDVVDYDTTTALLVVDVQNDFADPSGNLYVPGGDEAIAFINDQISDAVRAGATIAYTQDWHPESTPHFEKDGGVWPVHCVADTFGAEFHPDLNVVDDAVFIKKGVDGEDGYSAFTVRDPVSGDESSTGLEDQLEGITSVAVVGLALDVCVKESALDAAGKYDTTLLADGSRPVNLQPGDAARAVAEMAKAGVKVI